MGETKAIAIKTLECQECGSEIYTCDMCEGYFISGDILHCTDDKHYCKWCFEEVE